jgi:predicted metal-dependent hydrolase
MTADPAVRSITVSGRTLRARVVRRRVKNVNARLVGDELRVSAPHRIPEAELEAIVLQLARRLLRRVRARELNRGDAAVGLARRVAARFEEPPEVTDVVFVTTQRARWGSYSTRTGIVRVNAALRQMPTWVLEAVLAHELAHVVHPDHSPAFWELLRRVCPDTDRARAFLAGASWIARRWSQLPEMEREMLTGSET